MATDHMALHGGAEPPQPSDETIAKLLRDAHDQDQERTTIVITHDLEAFEEILPPEDT